MIPLTRETARRARAETLELSASRMFFRVFRVQHDGRKFLVIDKRTNDVVGCGFVSAGREEGRPF